MSKRSESLTAGLLGHQEARARVLLTSPATWVSRERDSVSREWVSLLEVVGGDDHLDVRVATVAMTLSNQHPERETSKERDGDHAHEQEVIGDKTISTCHDEAQGGEIGNGQHGVAHAGSVDTGSSPPPNLGG